MPQPTDLRGRWRRIAGSDCANAYPARVEFKETRYSGMRDPATQGFIVWDAGSYRVESDDVVMIQTANDSQERYRFRLAYDRLTFLDNAGCEIVYERDRPPSERRSAEIAVGGY